MEKRWNILKADPALVASLQDALKISPILCELLNEIGRTYAPFLNANAQAIAEGKRELEATIDDKRWIQPVFPYQVKCMQALQLERQKMTKNGQEALNQVLAGTGCEVLFN